MSAPIWVIPARAKAYTRLPMTATQEEIDAAHDSAARRVFECAAEGGMEVVVPSARFYVENRFNEIEEWDEIEVMAFAVCAKREYGHADAQD